MNWTFEPELIAVRLDRKLDVLEFETLLNCISPEKKEVIRGYFREEDQLRSLIGELLIRKVLIERCGMTNGEISFTRSEHGKPILVGAKNLHFNLAHAGDWVVCAVDSQPIGVDVEQLKTANLAVSRSFFSPEEHLDICNAPDPNVRFFDYWTLKESYLKQTGKGLSHPLNVFTILFGEDSEIGIEVEGKRLEDVFLKQYLLEDAYKLAVCGERLTEKVKSLALDEVAGFFQST
ncbi:MAG: 4'-phosphopantetheinyl transferase superfamily protein [Bacteroidota bacterium]